MPTSTSKPFFITGGTDASNNDDVIAKKERVRGNRCLNVSSTGSSSARSPSRPLLLVSQGSSSGEDSSDDGSTSNTNVPQCNLCMMCLTATNSNNRRNSEVQVSLLEHDCLGHENIGDDTALKQHYDGNVQTRNDALLPRSMDDFFTEAYNYHSTVEGRHYYVTALKKWRYYLMFILLGIANISDSTETVCIGYVLSNSNFQSNMLHDDLAVRGAFVASAVIAGMISGGILAGAFEDTLKRKQTLLLGLGNNAIMGLLSAWSPNVTCLIMARFLCGMGIGAITSVLTALASELSPPKERGYFVSITTGMGIFGSIFTSMVGYVCFAVWNVSWRIFLTIATIPCMVGFVAIAYGVPDSPRSLALHGNYQLASECANRTVSTMVGYNITTTSTEHDGAVLLSPLTPMEIEAHMIHESDHRHHGEYTSRKRPPKRIWSSMVEAWRNISMLFTHDKTTRRTTFALQILFAAIGSGSGVGLWINTILKEIHDSSVYFTTFTMALASIPGIILSAILIDRMGRKPLFASCVGLTSLFLASLSYVTRNSSSQVSQPPSTILILTLISCYNACFSASWNVVYVMVAEAFPTEVRGTGIGLCCATGRIAIVLAQFLYGSLVKEPSILLETGSIILMMGSITSFCIPLHDMSNQPLNDSIASVPVTTYSSTDDNSITHNNNDNNKPHDDRKCNGTLSSLLDESLRDGIRMNQKPTTSRQFRESLLSDSIVEQLVKGAFSSDENNIDKTCIKDDMP